MYAFFAWRQNTVMDVTFWIMDVTEGKTDKEISDVKNVNSLHLLSFPQTLQNWPLVLK